MRIKALFITGIIGIAVVAGVLQALATPHRKEQGNSEGRDEIQETPETGEVQI